MEKDKYQSIIQTLHAEFFEQFKAPSFVRTVKIPVLDGKASSIIGARRTGKTTLLYREIDTLLRSGISEEQIMFTNFEDDRLSIPNGELGAYIDAFYAAFPDNHNRPTYLFLDEIQEIGAWASTVRRLLDTKNVAIFLSGSSSKMLSKEIATELRGRSIATEVWPLSFKEYILAIKPDVLAMRRSPAQRDLLKHLLESYLFVGGFPEVIQLEPEMRRRILQEYRTIMILRDIIERYGISNTDLLNRLTMLILKEHGRLVSVNKTFNDFKSQGLAVSKNTLHEYLEYLEDAFFGFSMYLATDSVRKQAVNPRKLYTVDTGFASAFLIQPQRNYGSLFENAVYLELRRRNYTVHYHKNLSGTEVDFLISDDRGPICGIQCCYLLESNDTIAREQKALDELKNERNLPGFVLTPDTFIDLTLFAEGSSFF